VVLGKFLFWDEQLSSDDSMACGTCHLPEFGGTDGQLDDGLHPGPDLLFGTADDSRGSAGLVRQDPAGDFRPMPGFGLRRQATPRYAPTTMGAAYHADLFWDGRAEGVFLDPESGQILLPYEGALESQAVGPILNPVEMGHEGRTWQQVRQKLQQVVPLRLASNLTPDLQAALQQHGNYQALFAAAFGDPAITAARIAFALASYQRTLVPNDTPWDRYIAGQSGAMTPSEKAGWALFQGNGRCNACHWDPLFADDLFHNLGLRPVGEDIGRGLLTGLVDDMGAFKTPTLRNAGLRRRQFHNGSSGSLDDPNRFVDPNSVVNIYLNGGGIDRSNLDPFLVPLNQFGMTAADVDLILQFVRTALTDPRAAQRLPPFDHPDLRSMVQKPPRRFGPSLAGAHEPRLVDSVPSFPGNLQWKLGLGGGDGTTLGLVAWGFQSLEPAATVLGLPWQLQVAGWQSFVLQGAPGQIGHATWRLPLPNDPSLQLQPFYFQLFAVDALATGGIAASRGYEFYLR
jgi:cytochrome c peroxidase